MAGNQNIRKRFDSPPRYDPVFFGRGGAATPATAAAAMQPGVSLQRQDNAHRMSAIQPSSAPLGSMKVPTTPVVRVKYKKGRTQIIENLQQQMMVIQTHRSKKPSGIWFPLHKKKTSFLGITAYIGKIYDKELMIYGSKGTLAQLSKRKAKPQSSGVAAIPPKKARLSRAKFPTWAMYVDYTMKAPVLAATNCVVLEMRDGLWPSPFLSLPFGPMTDLDHRKHTFHVTASLEQFANEILVPAFQSNMKATTTLTAQGFINQQRAVLPKPVIATFLCLREVLTQNASRIFGIECLTAASADESGNVSEDTTKEEEIFSAKILATSVILAAIGWFVPDVCMMDVATQEFLVSVEAYDNGDSEFVGCFEMGRRKCLLPNGKPIQPQEEVAMDVSLDEAKKRHPCVMRSIERKLKIKPKEIVRLPNTNACHITLIDKRVKNIIY
jgi:hypothetical protein